MLTLFTVPKAFVGHIGVIQRNAIRSWQACVPDAQIILFGCDEGVAEVAAEMNVEHCASVRLSAYGAPMLDSIFVQARSRARHGILCFANSDIIFRGDLGALASLDQPFLAIGESIDAEVFEPISFENPHWRSGFAENDRTRGPFALDFFFFRRELYDDMPPFRIGRARYDNWMVWRALQQGAMVVDITQSLRAVHQRHDYAHLAGGRNEAYRGFDARQNEKLAGIWCYFYLHSVHDARFVLTPGGLSKKPRRLLFLRQWRLRLTGRIRELLGLAAQPVKA
ncbi:MAG: hypothetical protein VKN13_01410 [Cyanobacteriota bacterium]|nr:hypothetical protein [Cyanobacteriota bacterium]